VSTLFLNLSVIYIFIYLFNKMACTLTHHSPIQPCASKYLWLSDVYDKQCILTNGAGPSPLIDHRVCNKDGGIVQCDTNVLQGNHVQKVDISLEQPYFLASQMCFHGDGKMKKKIIM
jgi:hypothetical protein